MNKRLSNNLGMTLIELLGAIVILVIVSALTFPVIFNGLKTANTIQNETLLRDEADYLMVAILKDLYTTKDTEISKISMPEKNTSNYYLIKLDGTKTGFTDGNLIISDKVINTKNSNIKLLTSSTLTLIGPSTFEIVIKLQINNKQKQKIEFKNVIRTIRDIDKEMEDNELPKK